MTAPTSAMIYPTARSARDALGRSWRPIARFLLIAMVAAVLAMKPGRAAAAPDAIECHALVGRSFGDARIIATERVAPPFSIGSLATPPGRGSAVGVPFCRVVGIARPVPASEIRFEVWLPELAAWNGRLQGVGNGGFAGSIAYGGLAWAVSGGFAVAATDTGHSGDPAQSLWAIGHPERIEDLGWRAMHETTVAAKAITTAYYGRPIERAYYAGCSTGGRQGLVLAQRFPQDYDGIVIGAPAYDWARLLAFDAVKYGTMLRDPARWLSPAKLALLNAASIKACKGVNGLIDDPGACRFDPARLRCRHGIAGDCLGPSELAMARLMYDGIADGAGRTIYPGFTPGLEASWARWNIGSAGQAGRDSLAYPYPTGFYGNLVHQDPAWTIDRFDLTRDLAAAVTGPVGASVTAENPDLTAFFARGGKLLHYHGWHDPAIPAQASVRYFRAVSAAMGAEQIRSSYRLFMGTGMQHCAGGPGPNVVGGVSGMPPVRDADHDVIAAMARWVEQGTPPDRIIASHFTDNDPARPVDGQRPWCAWPAAPHYTGGDRRRAESYRCIGAPPSPSPGRAR